MFLKKEKKKKNNAGRETRHVRRARFFRQRFERNRSACALLSQRYRVVAPAYPNRASQAESCRLELVSS